MQKEKHRFNPSRTSKIFLIVMAVMAVILSILGILNRCGLPLIHSEVYLYGAFLMIFILPVWGSVLLIKRIQKKIPRMILTVTLTTVLFLLAVIVFTYMGMFASFAIPQSYTTLNSHDHTIVVLRALEADEEHMDARREARLAADPDGDTDYITDDFGYVYAAYPRKLGIFYQVGADTEGHLYTGYASSAKLMIDWPDDNTARFYLENAEAQDGGEWILRFGK